MADALVSEISGGNPVRVQISPSAPRAGNNRRSTSPCSTTDTARRYGRRDWEFESLQGDFGREPAACGTSVPPSGVSSAWP